MAPEPTTRSFFTSSPICPRSRNACSRDSTAVRRAPQHLPPRRRKARKVKPGGCLLATLLGIDGSELLVLGLLRGSGLLSFLLLLCCQVGLIDLLTLRALKRETGPEAGGVLRIAVQVDVHLAAGLVAEPIEAGRRSGTGNDAVVPILAIPNGGRDDGRHALLTERRLCILVGLPDHAVIGRGDAPTQGKRDGGGTQCTDTGNQDLLHGCGTFRHRLDVSPRDLRLPEGDDSPPDTTLCVKLPESF